MTDPRDLAWQVEAGNGGWVRFSGGNLGGALLYVRIKLDRGRPIPSEVYIDAGDAEVPDSLLRSIPLASLIAWARDDWGDVLDASNRSYGPDLSRLASNFRKGSFGRQAKHWVADSIRAQIIDPDTGKPSVPQAPYGPKPPPVAADPEPPFAYPENGLTDAFLASVAENYLWATRRRRRPAPFIQERVDGVPIRTVRSWIEKARERGFLPPTTRGSVS